MKQIQYPIRINHYLSAQGLCSRKAADKFIAQGFVKINGRTAVLGEKVTEKDKVELNPKIANQTARERTYVAYYKPRGIVTHPTGHPGEKTIKDVFKHKLDLFPIGRLDKDSHGLIIMTNDGRITEKLLGPDFEHEKEYVVKVDKELRPFFLRHMQTGINIEGYVTKPAKVRQMNDLTFSLTLTEGKHHQIRRMCAAFNYAVRDLKRVRIMNVKIGSLKPSESRELKDKELAEFLAALIV